MRFSLKWLLAGTVYVAIAAAALARPHWAYADLLWVALICAVTYSLLTAFFHRGPQRFIAAGFSIACLLVGLNPEPLADSPSRRIVRLFYPRDTVSLQAPLIFDERDDARVRAANAVGTMAAGLTGAVLGAVAYRRGRGEREGE